MKFKRDKQTKYFPGSYMRADEVPANKQMIEHLPLCIENTSWKRLATLKK